MLGYVLGRTASSKDMELTQSLTCWKVTNSVQPPCLANLLIQQSNYRQLSSLQIFLCVAMELIIIKRWKILLQEWQLSGRLFSNLQNGLVSSLFFVSPHSSTYQIKMPVQRSPALNKIGIKEGRICISLFSRNNVNFIKVLSFR